jgi:predicted  nucleic acid-binding Zn-ribbon protein
MTVRILNTCPICGCSKFKYQDDGFMCLDCGEFSYIEDMTSTALEVHELSEHDLIDRSLVKGEQ